MNPSYIYSKYVIDMSSNKKLCPVPFDQQPLNEYEALKSSLLFTWSTAKLPQFSKKLAILFTMVSTLSIILNVVTFSAYKISIVNIFYDFLFALFIIGLLLMRLYLGWSYILKRLSSSTIFYEESGWYDGQLWIKSADFLTQDRLVGIYQVEPVLLQIKKLFLTNSIFMLILFVLTQII